MQMTSTKQVVTQSQTLKAESQKLVARCQKAIVDSQELLSRSKELRILYTVNRACPTVFVKKIQLLERLFESTN
jgi:hypothetical protein